MSPIIPWKPFMDMEEWFEGGLGSLRSPRVDVYEDNGNVVAKIEVPGVDPKNVKIEVKDNVLTIEAKKEEEKEEKGKGYYRKEISSGYYKRAIPLPVDVIEEKAEARYEEGILKVIIPKAKAQKEEKKAIKIKVKGVKEA